MIHLRPFQNELERSVYDAWQEPDVRVVMAVAPTGSGKTVLFSKIAADQRGAVCAIAHRGELVSQISTALARNGVRHRIIGPRALAKTCASLHALELGQSFTDPGSRVAVAGVDTFVMHKAEHESWARGVGMFIGDEGHHFLAENKWGKACDLFTSAYGLLVTATPLRADGKGLGRHADGIVDKLIVGPSMRDLIEQGYLTGYRLICPASAVDYDKVETGATGDFNQVKLREAVHADDKIIGDVVKMYKQYAMGKLGITFAVDVEAAREIAMAFNAAGIPAEVVSAKTPAALRFNILQRFKAREILQLVNVDLFGEGFDVPACDVVSFARPTQSFSLYAQQFGRPLRLACAPELLSRWDTFTDAQRLAYIAASGKPKAIVIDHVSNVVRHNGPPDMPRLWSLDRRESRARGASDVVPHRICMVCLGPYPRYLVKCDHCGARHEAAGRIAPQQVDGDMLEISDEWLRAWYNERARIDGLPQINAHGDAAVAGAIKKQHQARKDAQHALREGIAHWAGYHRAFGREDREIYRRFYLRFSLDIGSAQVLNAADAGKLGDLIATDLRGMYGT